MEYSNSKRHQSKMTSIEETIQLARLQQAASTSALYERKHNQKALKVLTVAAYILFVSMAAIILSFYYIFIWDPTTKPALPRSTTSCNIDPDSERVVIPENVAIRLMNSTEITAENFFNALLKRFREDQKRLREQKEMPNGSIGQTPKRVSLLPFQSGSAIDAENQRKDSSQIATSTSRDVNTPSSTSISPIDSNQQNALSYVDDEDMVNDYDNVDGSGTRPLWNDTAATFAILNDNDVNNDSD